MVRVSGSSRRCSLTLAAVIAAVLLFAAFAVRPGRDLELALELRDHATEQLAAMAANPLDLAGQAMLGPLSGLILRSLRSAVGRGKDANEAAKPK